MLVIKQDAVTIVLISFFLAMLHSFVHVDQYMGFVDLFWSFGKAFFIWLIVSTLWRLIWGFGPKIFATIGTKIFSKHQRPPKL